MPEPNENKGTVKPGGPAVNILLAEDDLINQAIVSTLLTDSGCSVDVASDGKEAVLLANSNVYDLILMDINMPDLGGEAATRSIQANQGPNRNTPILAITGNLQYQEWEVQESAGMKDCIPKPVDKQTLLEKVARWSGRPAD